MVRIVIIDGQEAFCNSIKTSLLKCNNFEICGVGKDSYDTLQLIENHKPDIAVIEFELSGIDPIKLLVSIKARSEKTKVVFIARCTRESDIINLVKSGVPGCVGRNSAKDYIGEACQTVAVKKEYITHDLALKAFVIFSRQIRGQKNPIKLNSVYSFEQNVKQFLLSHAELKIAVCVSQGFTNKEIVKKLNLKEGTIRNYISSILKKTGLKHRTQIAIYALEGGFSEKIKNQPPDNRSFNNNFQFDDDDDDDFDNEPDFESNKGKNMQKKKTLL